MFGWGNHETFGAVDDDEDEEEEIVVTFVVEDASAFVPAIKIGGDWSPVLRLKEPENRRPCLTF